MSESIIEPYTFSQFVIDTYYETSGRQQFIEVVRKRYPQVKYEIVEAFWHVIDFMTLAN